MSTPESEVREASARFYAGLNRMANGEADALKGIWSQSAEATALHPIGGRVVGGAKVQDSFNQVAQAASKGRIALADQYLCVVGDLAYEVGAERGSITLAGTAASIDQRVTNIYRKEAGTWKIVHHHTDVSPAMVEILNQMLTKH